MNLLDKDYPVIARVASISATKTFCLNPKYREIMQYVYYLLPTIQKQKSHLEAETLLNTTLAEFGATCAVIDEMGAPTSFDDEVYVSLVIDSSEKVTLQ
jgi:hypothetical protein